MSNDPVDSELTQLLQEAGSLPTPPGRLRRMFHRRGVTACATVRKREGIDLPVPNDFIAPGFTVTLEYHESKPSLITVTSRTHPSLINVSFSREAFRALLDQASGRSKPVGRYTLRRLVYNGCFVIQISYELHGRHVDLELDLADIATFLTRTYRVVPPGTESRDLKLQEPADPAQR